MQNAVFLNNRIQEILVRQAVKHEIELYRKRGFSETSTEIRNLKAALPQLTELNGRPVNIDQPVTTQM